MAMDCKWDIDFIPRHSRRINPGWISGINGITTIKCGKQTDLSIL